MLRYLRRLLVTGLLTLLVVTAIQVTADASGVGRVSGVAVKAQNACASTMRLKWKAISGATYEVRWASAKRALGSATPLGVSRHVANVGPLGAGTSYFQVRAVRQGHAGAWSAVRASRFGKQRLGRPVLSGHGVPGGAQFTWTCGAGASRFRVAWSAAPFGKWPETRSYVSGWLPKSARSSTFAVPAVPQPGDHMLAVAYANPVFGQLDAAKPRGGVRHSTGWVPVFPTPADPGTGDPIRIGTYNVLGGPTGGPRIHAIAANISEHGLGMVALQEASSTTAAATVAALGGDWNYVRYANAPQQILYRASSYVLTGQGTFNVSNPDQPSVPVVTPWARFLPANHTTRNQPVYVVSAHVTQNAARSAMDKKHDAGVVAQELMGGINAANAGGSPVIIAGDLQYCREPYNDVPGYVEAPPTLVRGGYYDAMAAVSKTNVAYQTFNGGNGSTAPRQVAAQSGVAGRSDYLMLRGFRSSNSYVNVANWSDNGVVPSDHNLVYADVTVPYAG